LIVNEDLPAEVVAIFEQLLHLRYPIEKIRTVDNSPAAGLSTRSVERSTSTPCSIPTSTGRATSNPRTPHHTATPSNQIPAFGRTSGATVSAPQLALQQLRPALSPSPAASRSERNRRPVEHDGFSPTEFAVHVARRIHYTELYALCFSKEIAMFLTLSSSEFAVAVDRNYT
jgi:hypothetical protein